MTFLPLEAKLLGSLPFMVYDFYKKKTYKLSTSLVKRFQKSLVLKAVGLKCTSDFIRSGESRHHEKYTRNVFVFIFVFLYKKMKEGSDAGR